MSNLQRKLLFIFAVLFMTFGIVACTGDVVRVVVVVGESRMDVGEAQTLTASVRPISFDQSVTWETSNPLIATVDEDGVVLAVGEGVVIITATSVADSSKYKEFEIVITYLDPESMEVVGKTSMGLEEQQELTVLVSPVGASQLVNWQSSNPEIVSVNRDSGLATAHTEGVATITAVLAKNPEITAEIEITVTAEKYTITYNLVGGVNHPENPVSYTVLSDEIVLKNPTKAGFNFLGWYLTADYEGAAVTSLLPEEAKDITLYANWEKIIVDYAITYHLNGGILVGEYPTTYTELELVVLPVPTKDESEFLGWYLDAEFTNNPISQIALGTEGDIELFAKWKADDVVSTIEYVLNEGSWTWTTGTVTTPGNGIDAYSNLPELFMIDFYTYLKDNNLLDSPLVHANLRKTTWETFSANYVDPVAIYNHTSTVTSATTDGYSQFFYTTATGDPATGELLTIEGGFLGTEPYKSKYATVVQLLSLLQNRRAYGTNSEFWQGPAAKSLAGFLLDGYFYGTQGARTGDFLALRSVIPNSNLGYHFVGGSLVPYDITYPVTSYLESSTLVLQHPFRDEYVFKGWYDNPEFNGNPVAKITSDMTGNKKFYAKWEPVLVIEEYSITYELNGGAFLEGEVVPESYIRGVGVSKLPTAEKEGFVFDGWYLNNVKVTNIGTDMSDDLVLEARFTEIAAESFTVSYDLAGGEWLDTSIGSYEAFRKAFLADMTVYLQSLGWTGTEIPLTEDNDGHVIDLMGVTYNYATSMEAFFKTHAEYSVKWGWVYTFMVSKGADLSTTTLLRANTHAFVYRTEWPTWPYSKDYSNVVFADFEALIPAGESGVGVNEYQVGQTVAIPDPVKEGYIFLNWLLNGQVFAGITPSTTGDLELVAKWKKDFGDLDIIEVGPDAEFKTLAEALAEAQDGTIILLAPGTYQGATITVSGVTIMGPNADVDPNRETREAEAVFTSNINIKADNVVINGIELNKACIVGDANTSLTGLTIEYIVVSDFAASADFAPIILRPNTASVIYTDVVLANSLFKAIDGRMMIMTGAQIVNLRIVENAFLGTASTIQIYNDGIKLAYAAAGSFDAMGKVEIISNYFENYHQYPVWIGRYGVGTFDFLDNTFKDSSTYLTNNQAAFALNNYTKTAGEKVVINILYNTADNAQILARLRHTDATAEDFEAYVNYNKMYKNINTVYITNQGYGTGNLIDASNNYYDKTPTASFFAGVSNWQPYYVNDYDVPLYGQDVNVFGIEYELNGGELPANSPRNYDSRYGLDTLPLPTHPTLVFVRWEMDGVEVTSIPADTTGRVSLTAIWREDALYVGDSEEDYYYATLADAMAVAKAGDKIILDAGTYNENLTITLANLTIVGPNAGVDPNTGVRLPEAVLTGKFTVNLSAANLTLDGLAFTGDAGISGTQVKDLKFVNNYVYDTTETSTAWQETTGFREGFIFFLATMGNESQNLVFENNRFDNVHNVNINVNYVINVTFDSNVFLNFGRDAIRFDHGGYNSGLISFTNNEFLQDVQGGYNGIYFRIYGGIGINDNTIVIDGNKFVNIGIPHDSVYIGAISARNYQEKGTEFIIRNNYFESCKNYIRLRNNGTAANHAASTWIANIYDNAFIGVPATYYFANWTGSDNATTNPIGTHFQANYYEDNEGNVITDLSTIAGKFLNTASIGTALEEKPVMVKADKAGFFKIEYDLAGGTVKNLVYEYHTRTGEIELPEPTKANHQFLGWFLDDELVTVISAETRGDLLLVAKWQVLEGDFYDIEYVFDKGDWPTRNAESVEEVVDALFTDYYNWAVTYNNYTGTYEAFCKGADGKYQSGYWYVTINGKMRDATTLLMDETGKNDYFYNTPEYYYKWKPFFEAFNQAMLKVNAAQSFFTDTYAAMIRIYQFADWTSVAPGYYNAYLPAFYEAVQLPTEPVTTYRGGQLVVLQNLQMSGDLDFLGWYDNPEFEGEPILRIETTDSGDKVFYAKWDAEIMATEIIVPNEVTEMMRYTELQLVWEFNPSNTSDQRVEITSSNSNVIFVTPSGLLKANNEGTATIRIKAIGGSQIDKLMTIEVYAPGHFEIDYETDSFVVVDGQIKLNAKYINRDGTLSNVVWESISSYAEVNDAGVVTGLSEGLGVISASVEGDPDTYVDFYVTVLSAEQSDALKYVLSTHESNIFTSYNLGIGAGVPVYYKDIFGSVSRFLYEDLDINETYLARGNAATGHGGVKNSTEFICVHYTGNMAAGSTASANANYFVNSDSVSIHYVTGNDGIFSALDDDLVAYHAGDGTSVQFYWSPTGVMATENDPKYPVWGITQNSKFSINGVETTIAVPTGTTTATQKVTDARWINKQGLSFKVVDGQYYMGNTYWQYNQVAEGRISNYGGNNNSIGIESAVNAGSDLWYTWAKTAKLVAKLLLDNDLDITRVVGHHFFSAKDCPQPLLENNLEIWWIFIDMVEREYEALTQYQDYTFELIPHNELINDKGRVIGDPMYAEVITFTVKITVNGVEEEVLLASAINGIYSK